MEDKIKKYYSIMFDLQKHEDFLFDDINSDIKQRIQSIIRMLEVQRDFGILINCQHFTNWYRISDYEAIGWFGDDGKRSIPWSDDDRQPENEWLYKISFPSGAYVFNKDYPVGTFNAFFNELKECGPKYSDTRNNSLYFSQENAKLVHDNFREIFKKHATKVEDELRAREIEKLEKQISELKDNNND